MRPQRFFEISEDRSSMEVVYQWLSDVIFPENLASPGTLYGRNQSTPLLRGGFDLLNVRFPNRTVKDRLIVKAVEFAL